MLILFCCWLQMSHSLLKSLIYTRWMVPGPNVPDQTYTEQQLLFQKENGSKWQERKLNRSVTGEEQKQGDFIFPDFLE